MTAVFLVPLLAGEPERRRRLHRGVLASGRSSAATRCCAGRSGPRTRRPRRRARAARYVTNDLGELRLIGSLPVAPGAWRLVFGHGALRAGLDACPDRDRAGVCSRRSRPAPAAAALFGADVRFAMVAAAAGAITVLVLFAVGRGFAGRRALPLASFAVLLAVGAGVFVTTKLEAEGSSGERFRSLVTAPLEDYSVQERFVKWRTILAEADDRPVRSRPGRQRGGRGQVRPLQLGGHLRPRLLVREGRLRPGLHGAGAVRCSGFWRWGSRWPGAAWRRPTRVDAALALGACGALAAYIVDMSGAVYFEGLGRLAPWVLVGLGFAPFMFSARHASGSSEGRARPRAAAVALVALLRSPAAAET